MGWDRGSRRTRRQVWVSGFVSWLMVAGLFTTATMAGVGPGSIPPAAADPVASTPPVVIGSQTPEEASLLCSGAHFSGEWNKPAGTPTYYEGSNQ